MRNVFPSGYWLDVVVCAALVLCRGAALSDANEFVSLSVRAHELAESGKISAAIPVAQRAAEIAKQDLGENSPPYATAINRLADLYRLSGRWDDAEKLLKRARAIREKSDPDKVVDTSERSGPALLGRGQVCAGRTPIEAGARAVQGPLRVR